MDSLGFLSVIPQDVFFYLIREFFRVENVRPLLLTNKFLRAEIDKNDLLWKTWRHRDYSQIFPKQDKKENQTWKAFVRECHLFSCWRWSETNRDPHHTFISHNGLGMCANKSGTW